jgi:hypothetical protein
MNTVTRSIGLTYTLTLDPPIPWEEDGRVKRRVALDTITLSVSIPPEGKPDAHWSVGGVRLRQDGTASDMARYDRSLYWYNDGVDRIPVDHRSVLRHEANADLANLGLPVLGPTSKGDLYA